MRFGTKVVRMDTRNMSSCAIPLAQHSESVDILLAMSLSLTHIYCLQIFVSYVSNGPCIHSVS